MVHVCICVGDGSRKGGREGRGRAGEGMGPLLICLLEHYLVHPPSLPRLLLLLL